MFVFSGRNIADLQKPAVRAVGQILHCIEEKKMHTETLPGWMPDRALYKFTDITPQRTALIVIDMQTVFVEKGQPATVPYSIAIVPRINRLAASLRAAGGSVFFTRHTIVDEGSGALPAWQRDAAPWSALGALFRVGAREHEVDVSMDRRPEDPVLDKTRYSAFARHSSTLDEDLRERGIDTVIVVGVVTNCCCEATARDSNMLGYKTFFIRDATGALSDEEHNAALLSVGTIFADLRTTDEMIALIGGASAA